MTNQMVILNQQTDRLTAWWNADDANSSDQFTEMAFVEGTIDAFKYLVENGMTLPDFAMTFIVDMVDAYMGDGVGYATSEEEE